MSKPFSMVTGASAGIGLELAAISAPEGFDAADVAHGGFDTLMRGDGEVVSGRKNELQSAIANLTPASVLAEQHRRMAESGSARESRPIGSQHGIR